MCRHSRSLLSKNAIEVIDMNPYIGFARERYIKQESFVDEYGIYAPVEEYVHEGCQSQYRCILTREMFVQAYNKWIKDNSYLFVGEDTADDWCED